MIKCKLGELLKIKHGYAFKSENYVDKSNYALVTLANISETNNFKFNYEKTTFYGADFPNEFILKTGDLIMPLTEQVIGLIGNSAFVPKINDLTFVLNQRVGKVIYNENKVNKYYLHYLLATQIVKEQLEYRASGTKQRNISPENVYDVTVYIPELEVQNKIGTILYNIENKINNNNKIIAELESMAKTIYDYWFLQYEFPNEEGKPYKSSGGKMIYNEELKKEIPVGWKVKEVQDYCNIFTGKKDVNQALDKGKYKFFSCSPDYKYSDDKLYEGKAILISGNGSYTGRTIFVNDSFDLYQRTYACTNNYENDYMEYIYYSMLKLFVPRVSGGTHGSAIPYIVYNDIAKQQIVMDETIVGKFTNIIKGCSEKIINLNKENEELTKLRDELLPLLMNGQVSFKN